MSKENQTECPYPHETLYDPEYAQGMADCIAVLMTHWRHYHKQRLLDKRNHLTRTYLVARSSQEEEYSKLCVLSSVSDLISSKLKNSLNTLTSKAPNTAFHFYRERIEALSAFTQKQPHLSIHATTKEGTALTVMQDILTGARTGIDVGLHLSALENLYGPENFSGKSAAIQLAQTALHNLGKTQETLGLNTQDYSLLHPGIPKPHQHYRLNQDLLDHAGFRQTHGCLALIPPSPQVRAEAQRSGLYVGTSSPIVRFYDDVSEVFDTLIVSWGRHIPAHTRNAMIDETELSFLNGTDPTLPHKEHMIKQGIWDILDVENDTI